MITEKVLKIGVVTTMLVCFCLSVMLGDYRNKNIILTNKVDSLKSINDSLLYENSNLNCEIWRIELTLDHLQKTDSLTLVEFCEFYYNETE